MFIQTMKVYQIIGDNESQGWYLVLTNRLLVKVIGCNLDGWPNQSKHWDFSQGMVMWPIHVHHPLGTILVVGKAQVGQHYQNKGTIWGPLYTLRVRAKKNLGPTLSIFGLKNWPQGLQIGHPNLMVSFFKVVRMNIMQHKGSITFKT
jgi:hypothetical protein